MNIVQICLLLLFSVSVCVQGARENACSTCADILLVVDESGSIDNEEFGKVQDFLVGIVESFTNIGPPTGVQFGSLCFSSKTDQRHHFFLNTYDTKAGIVNDIQNIQNGFGGTYIGKALKVAREEGFTEVNGAGRSCAKKFVVVVTDGKSSDDAKPEATLLKDDDTTIISVGIGSAVNMAELEAIASDQSFVFSANTFDDLEDIVAILIEKICSGQDLSIPTEDSEGYNGFCALPCTLQNKTYVLCPCDENNANQTYSVEGAVDPTVMKYVHGTAENWECYVRSGRFYVLRRCLEPNKWEYICMRDTMYDSEKDIRVWCFSEWVHFENNPSICDVCNLDAFEADKSVVVKEQSVDCGIDCGIVVLESGFCGCSIPTVCSPPVNTTAVQCDACESSEGNDDGLCC